MLTRALLLLALLVTLAAALLLLSLIAVFAWPVLQGHDGYVAIWHAHWLPKAGDFGILPMIAGSLLLAFPATLLSWCMAVMLCGWLICLPYTASGPIWRMIHGVVSAAVRLMSTIPTIVYAFCAVFLLLPLLRIVWSGGSGMSWLAAMLVLSLLILPTQVLVLEAGLRSRFRAMVLTCSALGMTPWQCLGSVLLPASPSTLLSAFLLALSRALGDTLVALMLSGNAPQYPEALSDSLRTLTAHIALITANESSGQAYEVLFAAGGLLLVINAGLSLVIRTLMRKGGRCA